jgi:hypothetical protein
MGFGFAKPFVPLPVACKLTPHVKRCTLCGGLGPEAINAGGTIGWVKQECFDEWDDRQQTLEHEALVNLPLDYD